MITELWGMSFMASGSQVAFEEAYNLFSRLLNLPSNNLWLEFSSDLTLGLFNFPAWHLLTIYNTGIS
jgi:hypothetical protein